MKKVRAESCQNGMFIICASYTLPIQDSTPAGMCFFLDFGGYKYKNPIMGFTLASFLSCMSGKDSLGIYYRPLP